MAGEQLPIDEVIPEVLNALGKQGAVVVRALPGAGKTTRIPPALLDAGFANLENGKAGQIILLQPRRVAARAAATRIAQERGSELGREIGYQVRFDKKSSQATRLLVCTEGLFLRRLQDDPFIENVATVIFDEFHERSVDSDLALAMVQQIRANIRPEIKIVVMSATLNTEPVSRYLNNCPIVESPGRLYPVQIEYSPMPTSARLERVVADATKKVATSTSSHVLVFLPGVGEIRQTIDLLDDMIDRDIDLLTLYGDMPLDEQQKVLTPTTHRKIILATNVAETSLTIDGVTAVIDSGLARVNRLDPQLGLNRLELGKISKASADQRAGRAGRTREGVCLRLWSEREQLMLRDFEQPEISRVELSETLLQLIAWGETDVTAFPWFEAPDAGVVEKALFLLERLGALEYGKITADGKYMASLPIQPRLARLIMEGNRLGHPERAALCAALLSERSPFRRPSGNIKAEHHTDSDVIDRILAIENFEHAGERSSALGELIPGAAKAILRVRDQLVRLIHGNASKDRTTKQARHNDAQETHSSSITNENDAILHSIMRAFPDRICKMRDKKGRRAVMIGRRGVRLAEESAIADAEFFVAVELLESGQAESLVKQASSIDKHWLPQSSVSSSVEIGYDQTREKIMAMRRSRFCDLIIDEIPTAIPDNIDAGPLLAEAVREHFDVASLVDDDAKQYLARINCLLHHVPELELPQFDDEPWYELLPQWCSGCTSVAELRSTSMVSAIESRLTHDQIVEIRKQAPDHITLPNGRRHKLDYLTTDRPVLAVRIQELFGVRETPKIPGSRVPILLHLLAPNYRVQQITPDLSSFWKNTYSEVKKELKRRYPKHSWPDDPLIVPPEKQKSK